MNVTTSNTDKTKSDLNAHGLGEPLDDGEEGVGGEHGRLVRLRVDELAHVAVEVLLVLNFNLLLGGSVSRRTQQRPAEQIDAKRVL